mgnify:CR=1 FL=1
MVKTYSEATRTGLRPGGLKKKRTNHSRLDIGFLKTNVIKLRSGATSLFDVQRWMFDVQIVASEITTKPSYHVEITYTDQEF